MDATGDYEEEGKGLAEGGRYSGRPPKQTSLKEMPS